MKKDILNRKDIEKTVNHFYEKVKVDKRLSPFFSTVVVVNWEKHLPNMYSFWENVLFHTGNYTGFPMQKHQAIHQKHPMTKADFKQWIFLFSQSVDELFEGENANLMKQRAENMSTIMQLKIIK